MNEAYFQQISYPADSSELFAKIRHLPWAVYLDSCQPHSTQGRYDIISACPHTTLVTKDKVTHIQSGDSYSHSTADPFAILQQHLIDKTPTSPSLALPFLGGAIGYFSYDLIRRFENLPTQAQRDINLPEMAIGIYDWALIIDHQLKNAYLVASNFDTSTAEIIENILQCLTNPTENKKEKFQILTPFTSNMSVAYYHNAFKTIINYIHQGDCYQVNLAQRFEATYSGSPWYIYRELRLKNPAPYAAFLDFPQTTIMSLSPERFLLAEREIVTTKPMKGTRRRHADRTLDQNNLHALYNSEKDRAENVMIVDLLRNDLSKVCLPHSVSVSKLFDIESFPAVHQMVSTINGQLHSDKTVLDLLRACFPGGSITGAPKLRAMEIIEEVEPHRRAIYCGSIGYIDYQQQMDINIAIRTLLCQQNVIYCAAGGAIVADSTCDAEFQETLDKIAIIRQILT